MGHYLYGKGLHLENKIKHLILKKKKITQSVISHEISTSPRMIYQLESKKERRENMSMKLNMLIKLSAYFEINIETLLFTDYSKKRTKVATSKNLR